MENYYRDDDLEVKFLVEFERSRTNKKCFKEDNLNGRNLTTKTSDY